MLTGDYKDFEMYNIIKIRQKNISEGVYFPDIVCSYVNVYM